jgi:hypothetical protein
MGYARTAHPSQTASEALLVRSMGEIAYNAQKQTEAEDWIRSHPGEFARLTAHRVIAWWFPPGGIRTPINALVTILAFAGLVLIWRAARPLGVVFLATWIVYPLVYYIVQWSSKYRSPMDWELCLCAGVAIYFATLKLAPSVFRTDS